MTLEELEAILRAQGLPIEEAAQDMGKSVDRGFANLKKTVSEYGKQPKDVSVPTPKISLGHIGQEIGDERPLPPQRDFNPDQVRALEQMDALRKRDALLKKQLEQQAAVQAQSEAEFDPSSYQEVPRRFQGIKKRFDK